MKEKQDYGCVTVGYGTSEQKEIPVENFVRSLFVDNRLVTISQLEDESIVLVVENPKSSGREIQQQMWLSSQSFVALIATAILYYTARGLNLDEQIREIIGADQLSYEFSDNIGQHERI